MDILLLLGIATLLGLACGKLLENFGLPEVVGYILIGLLLGDSLLGAISRDHLISLEPINQIALGFIGFMVGGELKAEVFKKYGPKFFVILLCEGLLAALLVGGAVTLLTGKLYLGLLLGALASATAPAATVNVLWEYQSKGPLTTTVLAIVALDDGLALLLYAFAITFAEILLGAGDGIHAIVFLEPAKEVLGSLLLGAGVGVFVAFVLRRLKHNSEQTLCLLVGIILLVCGLSAWLELSQILSNMALGTVLINRLPTRKEEAFDIIKAFTPPIYILFFVFIGARLDLALLPKLGILGLIYLAGRTAGKMLGANLGARLSHAPESVRKYLGWALFSQAGVAVGLALDIHRRLLGFGPNGVAAGNTVIDVIAATTVVVQILGPPAVKYAIGKAGEIPKSLKEGS